VIRFESKRPETATFLHRNSSSCRPQAFRFVSVTLWWTRSSLSGSKQREYSVRTRFVHIRIRFCWS